MSDATPAIASFVAIGDSFTEGMNDTDAMTGTAPGTAPGVGFRGWADRLAEMLAARNPGFRYANLAVRGKLLGQIVNDQVPAAVSLLASAQRPALVSIAGGGNDLLRPGGDPDSLAELFDAAVARLRQAGSRVLMFTGFDPTVFPLLTLIRGRVATYNMHLRTIADAHGCELVDLWSMRALAQSSAWSSDRLHLSSQSHRAVAERAAQVLGLVPPASTEPIPMVWSSAERLSPADRAAWLAARRADMQWAREYFAPWVKRRLTGTSSGDGRVPKRPDLLPLTTPAETGLPTWPAHQGAGEALRDRADR